MEFRLLCTSLCWTRWRVWTKRNESQVKTLWPPIIQTNVSGIMTEIRTRSQIMNASLTPTRTDSNSLLWSQALNKLSVDFCQNLWRKTMERMINARLMWSLERQGLLFGEAVRFQEEPQYVISRRSFWNVYYKCLGLIIFYDIAEARYSGGPLGSWFQGPSPQVYSELPVRKLF